MKAADQFSLDDGHESGTESGGSGFDTPSLTEYLLTAADILNTKLQCKLVVLSSGHTGTSMPDLMHGGRGELCTYCSSL